MGKATLIAGIGCLGILLLGSLLDISGTGSGKTYPFRIAEGEGAQVIALHLEEAQSIRSARAFRILAWVTRKEQSFHPGMYELEKQMGSWNALQVLTKPKEEKLVRIPEGATIGMIDQILSENHIIISQSLVSYAEGKRATLEGTLFPDTYRFREGSDPESIVEKMQQNGIEKAGKALGVVKKEEIGEKQRRLLTLASILEREVPDRAERQVVAGILLKREAAGMPLQVDATVCYAKASPTAPSILLQRTTHPGTKNPKIWSFPTPNSA
jgi:UPF0755 protein